MINYNIGFILGTNIVNRATYIAGDTASNCEKGSDSRYPGLCKTTEIIDQALQPVGQIYHNSKLLTMPPMIPGGLLQARKPKPTVASGTTTKISTTPSTTTTTSSYKAKDTPLTASQIADLSAGLLKLKTKSEQVTFIDAFRKRNFV